MSKNKYFGRKQEQTPVNPTPDVEPLISDAEAASMVKSDGIAPGQVYEGVKVPDRPINTFGLTPGATLGPLVIEAPYTETGDGWWYAFFEGEVCTGIRLYVDAEMLKTGRLRK